MRRIVKNIPGCGETVILSWPQGRSFTGEEMVDLICHGIPEWVSTLYGKLLEIGARAALPGEFTARAWKNGRVTDQDVLSLAAAVETGRNPNTVSICLAGLRDAVSLALEFLEGEIEFQEEYAQESGNAAEAIGRALERAEALMCAVQDMERATRIWIMGPVNAGKSTLLNLLCGKPLALVHETPGTTRDGTQTEVLLGGRRLLLTDTPGFGGEGLDRVALESMLGRITEWDAVLWLSPDGESAPEDLRSRCGRVLEVASKADLHQNPGLRVSARTEEGLDDVKKGILRCIRIPVEEQATEVVSLLRQALEQVSREPAVSAHLLSEAEGILDGMTGLRHDLHAVERALRVLCVGK